MALHSDLLEQARHLATKEPKRPRQASLRRATSDAYYALFHFLIARASGFLISGTGADRRALRNGLARSFDHGPMKKTSEAFAHGHKNPWLALFPAQTVPAELRTIASSFVELQQARHEADYDMTRAFTRSEVLAHIAQSRHAISLWPRVANDSLASAYLVALLLTKKR